MYHCRFCDHVTNSLPTHLDHRQFHLSHFRNFHCGYEGCRNFFATEHSLHVHLNRSHGVLQRRSNITSAQAVANEWGKFLCSHAPCRKELDNFCDLLRHIKQHMDDGIQVTCPYPGCTKSYSLSASFTGHKSRVHKDIEYAYAPNLDFIEQTSQVTGQELSNPEAILEQPVAVPDILIDEVDLFVRNFANFYLKLETQYLVPVSTIQYIVDELDNIDKLNNQIVQKKMTEAFLGLNIPGETVSLLLAKYGEANAFPKAHLKLSSDFRRKKLYKTYLGYVSPRQIPLGIFGDKKRYFHYVPIADTLRSLLNDKDFCSNLVWPQGSDSEVISDITDGSVYKNNKFFQENPDGIIIILYQDDFEIVNVIGAAKNKYKLVAVYMSLGNLPVHLRSHINNIQLVALCRRKYFNQKKVFGLIVRDLKKIEQEGVVVSPGRCVKASLLFIAGDNLGSHSLGGFVENFSSSHYFCRYCLIERKYLNPTPNCEHREETGDDDDVESDSDCSEDELSEIGDGAIESDNEESDGSDDSCDSDGEDGDVDAADGVVGDAPHVADVDVGGDRSSVDYVPATFPKRTVDSYNRSLVLKPRNKKSYEGVKFNSIFNQLGYFHVCSPGLAPCLAHDLAEGVICHDLALFTRYFVRVKKWFTYDCLNARIEAFPFSGADARDKPAPLKEDCSKITGGAWQIWTLLRFYPLIIGDRIRDTRDPVWVALLKLLEIMEILTAPSIHKSVLAYLQSIINDYLYLRVLCFPSAKLRPKHHYLTHMPRLIYEFSVLLRSCTMRFESKHTFFKRVMRFIRNCKNVTLSLSEKHQLFQALLREGSDLRETLTVSDETFYHPIMYHEELQLAVCSQEFTGNISECSSIVFKGTQYKKGNVVVLRQESYQFGVVVGRITLLLIDDTRVVRLLVETLETEFDVHLRVFKLSKRLGYECVPLDQLLSYEPLHVYNLDTIPCLKLKHGLVSSNFS